MTRREERDHEISRELYNIRHPYSSYEQPWNRQAREDALLERDMEIILRENRDR